MPVYEYYCPTCQATFEKLQRSNGLEQAVRCAAGHDGARRLLSAFAISGRASEPGATATGGGCACGGGGCACGR